MRGIGFDRARMGQLALAAAVALLPGLAGAQPVGERTFQEACATCHGETAMGNGPMNEYMTTQAPSLRGLSAANGGEFPLNEVVRIIDGRKDVRGHGSIMPVWGAIFSGPLEGEIPSNVTELVVKGRILAVAQYLESLQE